MLCDFFEIYLMLHTNVPFQSEIFNCDQGQVGTVQNMIERFRSCIFNTSQRIRIEQNS